MDYFGLGTAISGVANAITSGLINKKNFDEQKRQYENNMNFQREQFQYQKELNNKLFEREDNAVQRRMADIKATGLNPLMADATGGAQATAGHSTSFTGADAPQHDYNADILPVFLSAMLDSKRVRNEQAQTELERERVGNEILNGQQSRLESLSRMIVNAKNVEEKNALIKQYEASAKLINEQARALGVNIRIAESWGQPTGTPIGKEEIASGPITKTVYENAKQKEEPQDESKMNPEWRKNHYTKEELIKLAKDWKGGWLSFRNEFIYKWPKEAFNGWDQTGNSWAKKNIWKKAGR